MTMDAPATAVLTRTQVLQACALLLRHCGMSARDLGTHMRETASKEGTAGLSRQAVAARPVVIRGHRVTRQQAEVYALAARPQGVSQPEARDTLQITVATTWQHVKALLGHGLVMRLRPRGRGAARYFAHQADAQGWLAALTGADSAVSARAAEAALRAAMAPDAASAGRRPGALRCEQILRCAGASADGATLQDLAAHTGLTEAGVSRHLTTMHRAGQVARARVPGDKAVRFFATQAAADAWHAAALAQHVEAVAQRRKAEAAERERLAIQARRPRRAALAGRPGAELLRHAGTATDPTPLPGTRQPAGPVDYSRARKTVCPSITHDARYQVAPGAEVAGGGFMAEWRAKRAAAAVA